MSTRERLVCASEQLADGATGMRFELPPGTYNRQAFAIRYAGKVHAYVNTCPHAGTELDWNPGEFFDDAGLYLLCATHGAAFEPDSGHCVGGPCRGQRLLKLSVIERDGAVYYLEQKE